MLCHLVNGISSLSVLDVYIVRSDAYKRPRFFKESQQHVMKLRAVDWIGLPQIGDSSNART